MGSIQIRYIRFLEFLNSFFYSRKSLCISAQTRRPQPSSRTGHVVPYMHMHCPWACNPKPDDSQPKAMRNHLGNYIVNPCL